MRDYRKFRIYFITSSRIPLNASRRLYNGFVILYSVITPLNLKRLIWAIRDDDDFEDVVCST